MVFSILQVIEGNNIHPDTSIAGRSLRRSVSVVSSYITYVLGGGGVQGQGKGQQLMIIFWPLDSKMLLC